MTSNVNGLNSPVKICRMTDWARKLDPPIRCLQETHFRCKGTHRLKVEGQKDIKSHGRRSLVGCSPWGCEELDTTEQLYFEFSFSCIGEGNGNPLQCSCLENPRDSGARWAAVYGVTQSRTQLKRLSSSSSILCSTL